MSTRISALLSLLGLLISGGAAACAESALPAEAPPPHAGDAYAIICSRAVWNTPEWKAVAEALEAKHMKDFGSVFLTALGENDTLADAEGLAALLRESGARYAAFVLKPEEVGRQTVTTLHRAARRVDDDPWGDCLWGIVSGATPEHALRIARASDPLVIKRLLATTNVHHAPFEHSYCITDWTNAPVREQSGCTEPTTQEFAEEEGRVHLFAEQLATQKPQLIVTSSHATQFNLEMPFGKGLIFPSKGRFYQLKAEQMPHFGRPLGAALAGHSLLIDKLARTLQAPAIEPDGEPRVWLAAGNCLIGNMQHSPDSMVATALSSYTCNQFVGYTVPSWYGKGGWGTLNLFLGNTEGNSLAEAWFLNNQFILHETMGITPRLLESEFNDEVLHGRFAQQMMRTVIQLGIAQEQARDAIGLVHDRDVVAFYGDPAWRAEIDNSHSARPLSVEWTGEKSFRITASGDYKGRAAIWFPSAATGRGTTGCDAPEAVFTNDFILFPQLELKKGEARTVNILGTATDAHK